MTNDQFIKKVEKTVCAHSMLDTDSLLVGFSGGVDSTVLLHVMSRMCADRGISLRALHVNHMIRGSEALRDEEFCRSFCRELGIPFESVRIDIPGLSKTEKLGLEECARKYRYAAFEKCRAENSIGKIATAHNANDNLETIIFNLSRGCSLGGICGIAPVRGRIIRPLIACSKDEIIGYARGNSLPYVYDSTNSDTEYRRNYIRHNIIPGMMELNPSLFDSVTRFSESAREDSEYLKSLSSEHADENDVRKLAALPAPILKRILGAKYEAVTGATLEAVHLDALIRLISKGRDNSSISLPGISAGISGGELILGEIPRIEKNAFCRELSIGENAIPECSSSFFLTFSEQEAGEYMQQLQNIHKNFILKRINSDKICGNLYVRNRIDGDKYRYGGMTRSVKKLLNSAGLDARRKAYLPFLCDSEGIIWIPGFQIRDSVRENDTCRKLYIIYYSGK